jgi:hypothetical protein
MQPDGNLVMYDANNGVALWSIERGVINYSTLYINQTLTVNQSLYSVGFRYQLILQPDGNLVLYDNNNGGHVPLWYTGYGTSPGHLIMQPDGNLVLYNSAGNWIWQSNTYGSGSNNFLVVQPDGNLVLYNMYDKALWQTATEGE